MNWLAIIATILKVIFEKVAINMERNKEIKQKKEEAVKEIYEGLKERNPSRITVGLDNLHNARM